MFARRLVQRARFVRTLSTQPTQNRWREIVGRTTLVTVVAGQSLLLFRTLALISLPATGTLFYVSHKERNPGPQLPFDPEKKTLVVLGSGWGATSLLKHLDTENYNTVRIRFLFFLLFLTARLDRYQSKELFPLHSSPPIRRSRYTRPSFYPTAYVSFPEIISIQLTSRTATRFLTRHKAREVSVIEAEATDVDVCPLLLSF